MTFALYTAVPAPVRYGHALHSKDSHRHLAPQPNQNRCIWESELRVPSQILIIYASDLYLMAIV